MISSKNMMPMKEVIIRGIIRECETRMARANMAVNGLTFKQRLALELGHAKTVVCEKFWA